MLESEVKKLSKIEISKIPGLTMYANPAGLGCVGKVSKIGATTYHVDGRQIRYGLGSLDGMPDEIGIYRVEITPEMVGKCVGIFCFIEYKRPKGKARELQEIRHKMLKAQGAVGLVVDDPKKIPEFFKAKGVTNESALRCAASALQTYRENEKQRRGKNRRNP